MKICEKGMYPAKSLDNYEYLPSKYRPITRRLHAPVTSPVYLSGFDRFERFRIRTMPSPALDLTISDEARKEILDSIHDDEFDLEEMKSKVFQD